MSNLSDLLEKVGGKSLASLSFAGALMGVLADISGAAGALMSLASFSQQADQTQSLLSELRSTLSEVLAELDQVNGRGRWQDISARWDAVDSAFGSANTVLGMLPEDLAHLSELDYAARSQRVFNCGLTVTDLMVPERWALYKDDPQPYRDDWNGPMTPDIRDSAGSVFDDRYVLPQLLKAISIYLFVLRTFLPNDVANFSEEIGRFRNFLIDRYVESKGGLRTMSFAFLDPFYNEFRWTGEPMFNALVPGGWSYGQTTNAYFDGAVEYYQPFGAVHLYSGLSSFGKFPPRVHDGTTQGAVADVISDPRIGCKLAIPSQARRKDVYRSAGLATLWGAIDDLGRLVGAPSYERDEAAWWSVRELSSLHHTPLRIQPRGAPDFLTYAWISDGTPESGTNAISGKLLLNSLYDLNGLPTLDPLTGQPVALSMRKVLERATLRGLISPADLNVWWGPLGQGITPPNRVGGP